MNFMSIYANIYNSTSVISKFFLFSYLIHVNLFVSCKAKEIYLLYQHD